MYILVYCIIFVSTKQTNNTLLKIKVMKLSYYDFAILQPVGLSTEITLKRYINYLNSL